MTTHPVPVTEIPGSPVFSLAAGIPHTPSEIENVGKRTPHHRLSWLVKGMKWAECLVTK